MQYREIIVVCFHIHTKHINTLCGQNVELVNVKPGGTYSDHWASKCWLSSYKTDTHPANLAVTRFLWNPKVNNCCYNSSPLGHVVKCLGPVDNLTPT